MNCHNSSYPISFPPTPLPSILRTTNAPSHSFFLIILTSMHVRPYTKVDKHRGMDPDLPASPRLPAYHSGPGKTAAHKTLPLGTVVRVTRTATGKSVRVTINDRGPYAKGRIMIFKTVCPSIRHAQDGVAHVDIRVLRCKKDYGKYGRCD